MQVDDAEWKSIADEIFAATSDDAFDLVVAAEAVPEIERRCDRKMHPSWIRYPAARDPQSLVSLIRRGYFLSKPELLEDAFSGVAGMDGGYAMGILQEEFIVPPERIRAFVLKEWLDQDSIAASDYVAVQQASSDFARMANQVADWLASKGDLDVARDWRVFPDKGE